MLYPTPIAKLIDSFSKLPGIGAKTATRLAFYTISMSDEDVNDFAKNLLAAKRELTYCSVCGRLTDDDPCNICTDETRDRTRFWLLKIPKMFQLWKRFRNTVVSTMCFKGLFPI